MKEIPILFSAPMVRAILENRKRQTRRIIKVAQPAVSAAQTLQSICTGRSDIAVFSNEQGRIFTQKSPYGTAGDRLWVRETWGRFGEATFFKADNPLAKGVAWKPSIHMPRSLCRLILEVESVKVDRLQDISEADAIAEGVELLDAGKKVPNPEYQGYTTAPYER